MTFFRLWREANLEQFRNLTHVTRVMHKDSLLKKVSQTECQRANLLGKYMQKYHRVNYYML